LPTNYVADTTGEYGKPYEQVLGDVLAAMHRHGEQEGWLPILHVVGDEVGEDAIQNSIAVSKAFHAADPKSRTAIFTSIVDPANDERRGFAGAINRIYLNSHTEAALRDILDKGSECALYNQETRYRRGIYLYKMRGLGCVGNLKFAFYSPHVDHWYDLDGREADYLAVFAHPDGNLRLTVELIRYREAVDDYRYFLMLERVIAAAPDSKAKAAADRWLKGVLDKMEIGSDKPEPWTLDGLDTLRAEAAQHILLLLPSQTPQ
jgi:hypothetical protein